MAVKKESRSILEWLKNMFSNITVEPVLFSHAFTLGLHFVTNETMLLEKVCRTQRHFSDDICDNLLKDPELVGYKELVQKNVAQWATIVAYIVNIPTFFLCMVVGPWSDKHGRKIPMVLTMVLKTMSFTGFLINAYFMRLPIVWMVVSWIPIAFGGYIFSTCLSYLSDVTTDRNRTKRISILSGIAFSGIPLGTLFGGLLNKRFGFVGVYTFATVTLFVVTIYTICRIEETRESDATIKQMIVDFFKLKNFKQAFMSILKQRDGKQRKHIVLSLISLGSLNLWLGTASIKYRYAQIMYTWGNAKYSYFFSSVSMFNKLFNMFVTPMLSKRLHFEDSTIGIIGCLCGINSMILFALGKYSWLFIIGGTIEGLIFMVGVASRSILSKSVKAGELGMAFGVAASFEAIGGLIGDPSMNQIYIVTVEKFPSCVFIFCAAVFVFILAFFVIIAIDNLLMNREKKYNDDKNNDLKDIEEENEVVLRFRAASIEYDVTSHEISRL